jgi:putative membrane protein
MNLVFNLRSAPDDPPPSPEEQREARRRFLIWNIGGRLVLTGLGLALAVGLSGDSIALPGGFPSWLAVTILLTGFNLILKPILILFTLPFVILTMGLGVWLINALLFAFAGAVVPGFVVGSFWAAIWGSLIVSLFSLFVNTFVLGSGGTGGNGSSGGSRRPPPGGPHNGASGGGARRYRPGRRNDDVIDI